MTTQELKWYSLSNGIKLWEIAKNVLNISDSYFSRKLRDGLSEEEIDLCRKYIDEHKKSGI